MTVRPILERNKSNPVLEGAGVRLDRAFGFGKIGRASCRERV